MPSTDQFPGAFIKKSSRRKKAPELLKTTGFSLEEFPIAVAEASNHMEMSEHWHRFFEIVIIAGGSAVHVLNEQEMSIMAGHVFVLPPGFKHAFRDPVGLKLINICFDPERLGFDDSELDELPGYNALFHINSRSSSRENLKHILRLQPQELCRIEALARLIGQESGKRPNGYRVMARARLYQVIVELSRLYDRTLSVPSFLAKRMEGAIKHLESHLRDEIDFDELPRQFHFSKRSFYRIFTSVTGESPLRYLRTCRLKEASRLLQETEKSITEVTFDVGFQDPSHFSRCFQEMFGRTPSEFRNQQP